VCWLVDERPDIEAAFLEAIAAGEFEHVPVTTTDCVWLCKLNERGMLRRSFVPPEGIRDLRSLTRTRSRLAQDQVRHQNRAGEDPRGRPAEDLLRDL
jgi:hypothetical protein